MSERFNDQIKECLGSSGVGIELPLSDALKAALFTTLTILYWLMFGWGYGKGQETIDEEVYGNLIRIERISGFFIGICLTFGWVILPLFNANIISKNNVIIYGVIGLMLGPAMIHTASSSIKEDRELYGDGIESSDNTFDAWKQIRMLISFLFCILGIFLINEDMSELIA